MENNMLNPNFKTISIHSYKHSGILYRRWDRPVILEENDEYLILINDKITISNIDNPTTKRTREPAVWIFPKGKWYNFISIPKENGLSTYINIASPYIIEEGALKYIDYDLDVKILPNDKVKLLDQKEYEENSLKYDYPENLKIVIQEVKRKLLQMAKKGHPFKTEEIKKILNKYKELKKEG